MLLRRGVYFLANDRVINLAIAFLNSFRSRNPTFPLCLIPFNDRVDCLLRLQAHFVFSVWRDQSMLRCCDQISTQFHNRVAGLYRKLAIWGGDYDEFLYIDCDTVVLENVEFAFPFLSDFGFVTSHSNLPHLRKLVWKDSIYSTGKLDNNQIDFAANTGFIASKKGCLTNEYVVARTQDARELLPHMALVCGEQPFLNYLIVTSGLPYTSLLSIRRAKGFDIPLERWAGDPLGPINRGRVSPCDGRVLLVHWAGLSHLAGHETMPHKKLWNFYRYFQTARCSCDSC